MCGASLAASLALLFALACGSASSVAPTELTPPASTLPLDRVLLDLTGSGTLARSGPFTLSGPSVNICWRVGSVGDEAPAGPIVMVRDATTGESRGSVATENAPTGCRIVPLPKPGAEHYLSITASPTVSWHVVAVGH